MNNLYVEALYNENRNAIPSWQGYQYQGQVATFYFLKYILECYKSDPNQLDGVNMKLEWLEDFIIFQDDKIKQIYQVKKTLGSSDYTDVMQNFILQQKIVTDDSCKWFLIYNQIDDAKYEIVLEKTYTEIYKDYIHDGILNEIDLLIMNESTPQFWIDNLKMGKGSSLPIIRYYILNLLECEKLRREELTSSECKLIIEKHLSKLVEALQETENDYKSFISQMVFNNLTISNLKSESQKLVSELINGKYLNKGSIMTEEDIVNSLFILLDHKLLLVKNRKTDELKINFEEIKQIFLSEDKTNLLWKNILYIKREEMRDNIAYNCDKCLNPNDCSECVITEFLNLDLYEVIDKCNLEYPKFKPENIVQSITNKLSFDKYNHLIEMLFSYKTKIKCIKHANYIELNNDDNKLFVSEYVANDGFSKLKLIDNIHDHLDVYKEYDQIITKCYSDTIDYEQIKLIKGEKTPVTPPKFMDILPIKFQSKSDL